MTHHKQRKIKIKEIKVLDGWAEQPWLAHLPKDCWIGGFMAKDPLDARSRFSWQ